MSEPPKVEDPFSQMLKYYEDWSKNWAGAMSQMVANKQVADTMAQQVETNLGAMALMRHQMGDLMEQTLQQMNLPSRQELLGVAERLTQIEIRLDDLEAKLDQAIDLLTAKRTDDVRRQRKARTDDVRT